jgi:hypothetical protein
MAIRLFLIGLYRNVAVRHRATAVVTLTRVERRFSMAAAHLSHTAGYE